jgi:ribonuclease PH
MNPKTQTTQNQESINIQNTLRPSGRALDQLRPIEFIRSYTRYAEGSVLACFGQTRVLCTASVLKQVPPHVRGTGHGWLTAEYSMLPRSTHTRSDREAARGKQSGRTQEIQRLIGRSLRAAVDLSKIGEHTIHLDCDVLQADGGTRTTAISGAMVALIDALDWMEKHLPVGGRNALQNWVGAISVGIYKGECVLDLDYDEDSNCDADMNLVMSEQGELIEIQGTAETALFNREQLNQLLDLGLTGMRQIVRAQKQALLGKS